MFPCIFRTFYLVKKKLQYFDVRYLIVSFTTALNKRCFSTQNMTTINNNLFVYVAKYLLSNVNKALSKKNVNL